MFSSVSKYFTINDHKGFLDEKDTFYFSQYNQGRIHIEPLPTSISKATKEDRPKTALGERPKIAVVNELRYSSHY